MPTDKQLRANRDNAKKSTGPKTPEGKAVSAANALRHGFRARATVLPEEDRDEFLELIAALEAEYQHAGPTEAFLVRELATSDWHLRRHARLEAGLYATRLRSLRRVEYDTDEPDDYGPQQERTKDEVGFDDDTRLMGEAWYNADADDAFVKLTRYRNSARRAYYQALRTLREHQQNRPNGPNSQQPPVPSTDSPDVLAKTPVTASLVLAKTPVTGSSVPRRAVSAAWTEVPVTGLEPRTPLPPNPFPAAYDTLKRLATLCP